MGSGHLRTLGFARYLPEFGWEPVVLTAAVGAYPRVNFANNTLVPSVCEVHRSFALDTGRHLAIRGKYLGYLAAPDRWISWWPFAVRNGLHLIHHRRFDAIWSTYPIMTAHGIARTLSRRTRLPWIADFRDPVASSVSSLNRTAAACQMRCERRVMSHANRIVCTTPGAMRAYSERYPEVRSSGRLAVIQNGYDEADFASVGVPEPRRTTALVLLHSGLLYPDGRDPSAFFAALARLRRAGKAGPEQICVVLRASGCESRYQHQIDKLGIADIVTLAPPIGNREALVEQSSADALLLFQGSRFDRQIPAKLYEYLRIGKPIFALVGSNGDTAGLLHEAGGAEVVGLDDEEEIALGLVRLINGLAGVNARACGSRPNVARWSRRQRALELAQILDQVTAQKAG